MSQNVLKCLKMCLTSNRVFFKDLFHRRRRLFRLFNFFDFFENETKRFFWRRICPLSVALCLNADSVVDICLQIFNLDFRLRRRQISQRFVAAKQLDAEFQVRKRRVFNRPRDRRRSTFNICGHKRRSTNSWRRTVFEREALINELPSVVVRARRVPNFENVRKIFFVQFRLFVRFYFRPFQNSEIVRNFHDFRRVDFRKRTFYIFLFFVCFGSFD